MLRAPPLVPWWPASKDGWEGRAKGGEEGGGWYQEVDGGDELRGLDALRALEEVDEVGCDSSELFEDALAKVDGLGLRFGECPRLSNGPRMVLLQHVERSRHRARHPVSRPRRPSDSSTGSLRMWGFKSAMEIGEVG